MVGFHLLKPRFGVCHFEGTLVGPFQALDFVGFPTDGVPSILRGRGPAELLLGAVEPRQKARPGDRNAGLGMGENQTQKCAASLGFPGKNTDQVRGGPKMSGFLWLFCRKEDDHEQNMGAAADVNKGQKPLHDRLEGGLPAWAELARRRTTQACFGMLAWAAWMPEPSRGGKHRTGWRVPEPLKSAVAQGGAYHLEEVVL